LHHGEEEERGALAVVETSVVVEALAVEEGRIGRSLEHRARVKTELQLHEMDDHD